MHKQNKRILNDCSLKSPGTVIFCEVKPCQSVFFSKKKRATIAYEVIFDRNAVSVLRDEGD
ncbi:hypothetical protein HNQ41_001111 [Texcoconibacillus texcoconensis]|uniref:Uncharacterized protein n=1 Tax=Texcoconibacillus texcoconensis TaxID=1095777 RepID=A0A840QNL7_9BACI|nr:hypothetical protein [Texcoconibacillus texcoconensis]